jgi:hypothetical protein
MTSSMSLRLTWSPGILGLGLGLGLALSFAPACAGKSPPPAVELSTAWPGQARPYAEAVARWTRRDEQHDGFTHIMTVSVTALSPEWRAAYVAERARLTKMTDAARAELEASEQAAGSEALVFEVLFATAKNDWNDLQKWPRSMWRVALTTSDGREVLPSKIEPDKRVRAEIATWFPDLQAFMTPYVVTFPAVAADGQPVLGEATRSMTLTIASPVGGTTLTWGAAK